MQRRLDLRRTAFAAGRRPQSGGAQAKRATRPQAGRPWAQQAPSREDVLEAPAHVGNDDLTYDEWIRVGFALYHGLGQAGRDVWEEWSAQSSKNDPAVTSDKWPSFSQARNITVGTLFWLAAQNGWRQRKRATVNPDASAHDEEKPSGRPAIRIKAGQLPWVIDQGEQALIAARLPLPAWHHDRSSQHDEGAHRRWQQDARAAPGAREAPPHCRSHDSGRALGTLR